MAASRFLVPISLVALGAVAGAATVQTLGGGNETSGGEKKDVQDQAAAMQELASNIEAGVAERMESYLEDFKAQSQARSQPAQADAASTEELTAAILARLEDAIASGELAVPETTGSAPSDATATDSASPTVTPEVESADLAAMELSDQGQSTERPPQRRLEEIHFVFDSAELSPGAQRKTRRAAETILVEQPSKVRIQGFSDTMGTREHNEALALERASSVAELLVAAGVPAEIVEVEGMGESPLPEPTGTGVREPLNRCVAITAIR